MADSKYMKALMDQMSQPGVDQTIIPGTTKQASGNIVADLGLFGGNKQQQQAAPIQPAQSVAQPAAAPVQPAAVTPGQMHRIKIQDDFGDEQEMEINLADEVAIREFAMAKHREKHIASELELIKQQLESERKRAKELTDKYGKLSGAKSQEEMADLLLDGGFAALVERKVQEAKEFEKLSPEAKAELQRRQSEENRRKEIDRAQSDLDAKLNKLKEAEGKSNREAELTLYRQATSKYCPNDASKPELNKIHKIVWDEANSEIQKLKSEGITITSALVDQKFQKAFLNNKSLIQSVRGVQTNTVTDATNKVVNGDAVTGMHGSNNSASAVNESELLGKWMNLMSAGKGGEVIAEIQRDPKALKPVYEKLIQKLRGR